MFGLYIVFNSMHIYGVFMDFYCVFLIGLGFFKYVKPFFVCIVIVIV
jgi:hypothetical protein